MARFGKSHGDSATGSRGFWLNSFSKQSSAAICILFLMVLMDQMLKSMDDHYFNSVPVKFLGFSFLHVINRGGPFSIGPDWFWSYITPAIIILGGYRFTQITKLNLLGMLRTDPTLLIIAGMISNTFDRIVRGGVIDYIAFSLPGTNRAFATNLADIAVIVGIWGTLRVLRVPQKLYNSQSLMHQRWHPKNRNAG